MICKICGNENNNKIIEAKEMNYGFKDCFEYMECGNCGCLQIVDIPEDISKYYPPDYGYKKNRFIDFLFNKRNKYLLTQKSFIGKIVANKEPSIKFSTIHDVIQKYNFNQKSSILDVGCGSGLFLSTLKYSGFKNIMGIDLFVDDNLIYPDIKIVKTSLEEFEPSNKFDLIFLNHSFEHMENPLENLLQIKKLLTDNGKCIITIPVKTEAIYGKYKENWVQLDAPRHFYLYSLESFNLITKNAGLKLVDVIFNSEIFQFWGSEQYLQDIPLKDDRSYGKNFFKTNRKSIFTKSQIKDFENKTKQLNEKQLGDQAIFILEINKHKI